MIPINITFYKFKYKIKYNKVNYNFKLINLVSK